MANGNILICVETREVVRCEYCRLMQYRTSNSLCRRCHKPLDFEEPEQLAPQMVTSPACAQQPGRRIAGGAQVRRFAGASPEPAPTGGPDAGATHLHFEDRKRQGDSDTGLAGAPSLALGVEVRNLVRDARSRRDEEVTAILSDPFLAEIAPLLPQLDSLHRTLFFGALRDAATGRRRTA